MEDVKVSEEYKRAYNQADMLCTHMPHLLEGITMPENEPSDYTKGFQDRVRQYEIEQNAVKNFSYDKLKDKYEKDVGKKDKNKMRGMDKE